MVLKRSFIIGAMNGISVIHGEVVVQRVSTSCVTVMVLFLWFSVTDPPEECVLLLYMFA